MYIHKTVLVSCHITESPQAVPLATSILKSYQPYKNEVEVILEDYYMDEISSKTAEDILKHNPDSIGFSMYIWNRDFFVKTAAIIKDANKDIIIFAGGPEITATSHSLMDNANFDYLIRGEGEIPFAKLLEYLTGKDKTSPGKLLNMSYLKDINLIPSPVLNSYLDPSKWEGLLWELSRGCPYNCSFCSESRGVTGVRYYNEERIQKELILFENKKVEQIFVLDPTFNTNRTRAISVLSLIKRFAPKIHFIFEIRAELLDEELAKEFSDLNCSLQIGLQSSQKKVLKNINRSIIQNQFSEKINFLNMYGVVFGLDLIYGLPGDNLDGFTGSLDYALNLIPNHLDIFRLSVFPGTELYEKADSFNLLFENEAPYSVISSPEYSKAELSESEEIAMTVDLFYNKGKSAGWFLSVIDILDMTPSAFIIKLRNYIKSNNPDIENIYKLQNKFLSYIFELQNKLRYLPAALDLCQFHFLFSEALYSQKEVLTLNTAAEFCLDRKYVKSSRLQSGTFNFDASLYADQGMINIESFIQHNSMEKSYAVIFNNGYNIETISIEKYLYDILIAIEGRKTLTEIFSQLKIEADEVEEFTIFLIEEGLIIPVES